MKEARVGLETEQLSIKQAKLELKTQRDEFNIELKQGKAALQAQIDAFTIEMAKQQFQLQQLQQQQQQQQLLQQQQQCVPVCNSINHQFDDNYCDDVAQNYDCVGGGHHPRPITPPSTLSEQPQQALLQQGLSELEQAKEDATIQFKLIQNQFETCQGKLDQCERELKQVQKRLLKHGQQLDQREQGLN